MSGPLNRVIEAVALIATKLSATVTNTGNRLADNLEAIAEVVDSGGGNSPYVYINMRYGEGEEIIKDHTYSDVVSILNDGKVPVILFRYEDSPDAPISTVTGSYSFAGVNENLSEHTINICFICQPVLNIVDDTIYCKIYQLIWKEDDSLDYMEATLQSLPA